MSPSNRSRSGDEELDALLRTHGSLEGLARELGQYGPSAKLHEPAANENAQRNGGCLWQRLLAMLRSICINFRL
jgi:hypothetical protein